MCKYKWVGLAGCIAMMRGRGVRGDCVSGCEHRVLKALKSHTRTLSLDNSNLQALPPALGRLTFLTSLSAKNNALRTLPQQITSLSAVRPH